MLEEITQLCNKYSIEDLILKDVEPHTISEKCKDFGKREVRDKVMRSRSAPPLIACLRRSKEHYEWDPFSARLLTNYNTGTLVFRRNMNWVFSAEERKSNKCMEGCQNSYDDIYHSFICRKVESKMRHRPYQTVNQNVII